VTILLDSGLCLALFAAATALLGCAEYDGPPEVTLANQVEGLLPDPTQPIVLQFSEPPDPGTLRVKLARFDTDAEGNLLDEDDPALPTELAPAFVHEPGLTDEGGTSEMVDPTTMRITLNSTLPIGPSLVLILEPHLADMSGNETLVRKRLQFGYKFECKGMTGTQVVTSGAYFFLADIEEPIATQLQLLVVLDVDAATGLFVGQFTNADRNRDPNRCPTPCAEDQACQLIPTPKCVIPSEKAGTVDEYPDWVPNFETITGYTFTATGCVEDQADGTAAFINAPVDVTIQSPPVTVKAITLGTSFTLDTEGVLRGTGSVSATEVFLGTSPSGSVSGSLTARSIPEGEAPPNLPKPPEMGAAP
jgi:hypothetical protein